MIPDEAEIFEYCNERLRLADAEYAKHMKAFEDATEKNNVSMKILEGSECSYWQGVIDATRMIRKYVRTGVKG